jgi:hypothetical protein
MENLTAHIQVIVSEPSKASHSKEKDLDNEKGYVKAYKRLAERVSSFALEFNPNFEFFHVLVSTVIESAHNKRCKRRKGHRPFLQELCVKKHPMNLQKAHRSFFLKQLAIVLLAVVLLQPLVNAVVLLSIENYELELVQADDETSSNENEKQEKDSEEKLELQMAGSSDCSMEIPIPPPESC